MPLTNEAIGTSLQSSFQGFKDGVQYALVLEAKADDLLPEIAKIIR